MKFISLIPILFLVGCTMSMGQPPNEEMKKEEEFQKVLQKARQTQQQNKLVLKAADEHTQKTITMAAEKIVDLKEEVKDLKVELNEVNQKLDNITDTNRIIKFNLRPISNDKENR